MLESEFNLILEEVMKVMSSLRDNRGNNNAKKYSMESVGIGALSVFMMQDASFLSHQQRIKWEWNG